MIKLRASCSTHYKHQGMPSQYYTREIFRKLYPIKIPSGSKSSIYTDLKMRPIREKIAHIHLSMYICFKIIPLRKLLTLLNYHQFLKILFLQLNFVPFYPEMDHTMTIGIMFFGNYSTDWT